MRLGAVYVDKVRVRADLLVPPSYVRIHNRPKRYKTDSIDWAGRIVFENENFLVVDKPAGVPVPPTVDNFLENTKYHLEQVKACPLYVTHRLDTLTEGLLLLAKTPSFQSAFNRLLAEGRVEKEYEALTRSLVPVGLHEHYMEPGIYSPKRVLAEARPGWKLCQLEVLSCVAREKVFASRIRLMTGRTHQIRVQFQAMGHALVGDPLYGTETESSPALGLRAGKLEFTCPLTRLHHRVEVWESTRAPADSEKVTSFFASAE